jgi:hypothetical protein
MSFLKRLFGGDSSSTDDADDPVMNEREALMNATANVLVYMRSGDIQAIDKDGKIISPNDSDGNITGIWVRAFPSNTTKKAFLLSFCVLLKHANPAATDASQHAVFGGHYRISENPEKGGFNVHFTR